MKQSKNKHWNSSVVVKGAQFLYYWENQFKKNANKTVNFRIALKKIIDRSMAIPIDCAKIIFNKLTENIENTVWFTYQCSH